MKKYLYTIAFSVLGGLIGFVFHATLEIWYLRMFSRLGSPFGNLTPLQWTYVHIVGIVVLGLLGLMFGYMQARYWWNYLYGTGMVIEPRHALHKRVVFGVLIIILICVSYFSK